jgi:hypothetical protein
MGIGEFFAGVAEAFKRTPGGPSAQAPVELLELWSVLETTCARWIQRWLPYTLAGVRCTVPPHSGPSIPCGATAIQQCAICAKPTCLRHAMVHTNGDVVCVQCVNAYLRQVRGAGAHRVEPGPRPEPRQYAPPVEDEERTRKKHLKALGLTDPTDWAEIQDAFKRLAFKHHPDRHARAPHAKQQAAQRKFVELNAAYQWLSARERSAA